MILWLSRHVPTARLATSLNGSDRTATCRLAIRHIVAVLVQLLSTNDMYPVESMRRGAWNRTHVSLPPPDDDILFTAHRTHDMLPICTKLDLSNSIGGEL